MKRESHAMLAHQTKQVLFLLPKIGTQNETLDSDIEEGCQRNWRAQQGPSGGEALGGQHPGRRSPGGGGGEEDDSLNIDTSFSYFQLSLS